MGNELKPVVGSAAEQNHEEITIPPFVQNMVKIGRIVSRLGTTPLAYAEAQIRFLESCEDEIKALGLRFMWWTQMIHIWY